MTIFGNGDRVGIKVIKSLEWWSDGGKSRLAIGAAVCVMGVTAVNASHIKVIL